MGFCLFLVPLGRAGQGAAMGGIPLGICVGADQLDLVFRRGCIDVFCDAAFEQIGSIWADRV